MSEQNALVSAGGAQATSSEHTPSASPNKHEVLYTYFGNRDILIHLSCKTCPAVISCQSASALSLWISSWVDDQKKVKKKF
jgi:hypothetical protein